MSLARPRHRPSLLAALACGAASLAAAPSPASALAHVHSISELTGRAKVGGIALRTASLVQTGAGLQFDATIGTHGREIPNRASVCLTLRVPSTQQWCFKRRDHAWHSTVDGKSLGTVTALGRGKFVSQLPLDALAARPGTVRWSVTSHVPHCVERTDRPCDDYLPVGHGPWARGRLWTPVATGCTAAQVQDHLVTSGPPTKQIAIAFDDGPSAYTAQIQAILRPFGVHATFFVIGQQVAARAADLRRALADGDELGDHSWDHPLRALTGNDLTSEITRAQAAIQAATGFTPCLFRPPGGEIGAATVSGAAALGLATITWSVDPRDWAMPGTGAIESGILDHVAPGAIILDHDGGGDRSQTLAALPTVLETLQERGYRFVTVSQLLGNATTYGLRPS